MIILVDFFNQEIFISNNPPPKLIPLIEKAIKIKNEIGKLSISLLARRLQIRWNIAKEIISYIPSDTLPIWYEWSKQVDNSCRKIEPICSIYLNLTSTEHLLIIESVLEKKIKINNENETEKTFKINSLKRKLLDSYKRMGISILNEKLQELECI